MVSERTQRQIDRLLDAAEEAFGRGDWAALREAGEKALLLDPENRDARAFLAAAERALGVVAAADPPAAVAQPAAPSPSPSTRVLRRRPLPGGAVPG